MYECLFEKIVYVNVYVLLIGVVNIFEILLKVNLMFVFISSNINI